MKEARKKQGRIEGQMDGQKGGRKEVRKEGQQTDKGIKKSKGGIFTYIWC